MSPKSTYCALTPSATICRNRAFKEVKLNEVVGWHPNLIGLVVPSVAGTQERMLRRGQVRPAERHQSCRHLELGRPASRTVRKQISVA